MTAKRAAELRTRALSDPVWWMREVLGCSPWDVQAEIAEAVRDNRRVAVPSCHASGKSYIAARVALWWLSNNPYSLVLTTAPTGRQVRHVLWREIRMAHSRAKPPGLGGEIPPAEPRLRIKDGWMMIGFSTDDADRFQGWHADSVMIVADEAPGIPETIWGGIEGVMAAGDTRLLAIGNPVDPSGPFYQMCQPSSGVKKIGISVYDTPNFTAFGITEVDIASGEWEKKIGRHKLPYPMLVAPEWVAGRYQRWGPASPMYHSRVLGSFPESATDSLLQLSWVEAAQERWLAEASADAGAGEGGPVVLAGDIARFGSDESVAILRRGHRLELLWTSVQEDTMQTAGRFSRTMRELAPPLTVIDEPGLGAGVVDRLKELKVGRVLGVNTGQAAEDSEQFANARAEWWWGVRGRFERGDISIPPDEELASQLTTLKYRYTSKGQILMESKEDMRKRGLPSPDKADAAMLAFAATELSGRILQPGGKRKSKKKPFDTFPDIPVETRQKKWL